MALRNKSGSVSVKSTDPDRLGGKGDAPKIFKKMWKSQNHQTAKEVVGTSQLWCFFDVFLACLNPHVVRKIAGP